MKPYSARILIAAIKAEDGTLPEWYTFFPEGWIEIEGQGKALVDRKAYEAVTAYFKRRGNDVVIDYEHQTVHGTKAPASGWIREFRYREGVGIQGRADWTEEAAKHITKDEYRYFSPVFLVRKSDSRVIAIHSVALTNAPRINHLTPLLAKLGADFREEEKMNEFLKTMIAKLGLAEDASESDVLQAVDTALADKAPREVVAKEVLDALDLAEGEDASTVVASIHALKQAGKGTVSREEFEKVQKDLAERDAKEIVAKAMTEGKVTPDQKDWAMAYASRDLPGFTTFVAKAPVVIPVDNLPGKKEKPEAPADEAVLAVAKLMGNTKEDLEQFGDMRKGDA